MEKEIQKVEVAVSVSGDYAAWHELNISLLWDYTNNKSLGYGSKEEVDEQVERGHDGEYSDCEIKSAILVDGEYYIKL